MTLRERVNIFPSPEGATAMSPLQQRMLEDMQLRGLSARTAAHAAARLCQGQVLRYLESRL
jgi:hypothetical protein